MEKHIQTQRCSDHKVEHFDLVGGRFSYVECLTPCSCFFFREILSWLDSSSLHLTISISPVVIVR